MCIVLKNGNHLLWVGRVHGDRGSVKNPGVGVRTVISTPGALGRLWLTASGSVAASSTSSRSTQNKYLQ